VNCNFVVQDMVRCYVRVNVVKKTFGFHDRQEFSGLTRWLIASQGISSVQSVVFSDLLISLHQNEVNYLNRLHSVITQQTSLKDLCVLFHTHCIYLHYVLRGPIYRTLSPCFVNSRP
jgi:hypothetical protein